MRHSGGLKSETINISMVFQAVFKGNIEAIVAMVDHSNYLKLFLNFVKLIWDMTYCVCFMCLIAAEGRLANVRHRNCPFRQGFCMLFLYVFLMSDRDAWQSLIPSSTCPALWWGGGRGEGKPPNEEQMPNPEFRGTYVVCSM